MAKSIRGRVDEAFSEIADDGVRRDQVLAYIQMLRDSASDRARVMRHSVTLALAAAFLFLLLQTDLTPKLSLGPFEFLKDSILSVFLSSAVAYLFLEAAMKVVEVDRLVDTLEAAFANWNRKLYDNDLEVLLVPDSPIYFAMSFRGVSSQHESTLDKFYLPVMIGLFIPVTIIPGAFQVYAFAAMFSTFGWGHPVVWLNIAVASVLTSVAYWVLVSFLTSGR